MADDRELPPIALDPLAGLRAARASWSGGEALDATLDALEGPLGQSFLLDQPNVAGMGVAAWGLSTFEPAIGDPEAAARRMVGRRGPLSDLLGPEDEAARDSRDDPDALTRGADLLDALQTLDAAAEQLDPRAPLEVHERVDGLRRAVQRRLTEEARLSPTLRHHLRGEPDRATLARRLRGGTVPQAPDEPTPELPRVLRPPRPAPEAPYADYTAALDAAVAREPEAEAAGLAPLRAEIRRAAQAAVEADPESAGGRRAVERARRLMAREVDLSGGALGTAAGREIAELRRALVGRPSTHARPTAPEAGGVQPAEGLPEIPIMSSRGPKARVVGFLAAGEATEALDREPGFVRVPAPGRKRPGWVRADLLRDFEAQAAAEGLIWPGPLGAPGVPGPAAPGTGGRPSPDLARLAALVARETGRPLDELMAELARPLAPATPQAPEAPKPGRRKARGAAARSAPDGGAPISVGRVQIDGLDGAEAPQAAAVLQAALSALPAVLDARLRGDPERVARLRREGGRQGELSVPLRVAGGGDPQARGRVIADQLADALIRSGARRIETLRLGVEVTADRLDPAALFDQLSRGESDAVAETLAGERKTLDGTVQGRLARFFGHDFKDVMLFAGPMAAVLARAIQAEAFTHGKQIFFDPARFRPDSARGEALLAHELTHTRQADDRDVRIKEAEAMIAEAAYLDWLQPGGAPLAFDAPEDLINLPEAAAASEVTGGALRARKGHTTMAGEGGARLEKSRMEERIEQVLEVVRRKLRQNEDWDAQRIGKVDKSLFGGMT